MSASTTNSSGPSGGSQGGSQGRSCGGQSGYDAADREVDARGLLCPEPLVRCRQAFAVLPSGGTVHVIATDPHAEIDFEVFARRTRHRLVRREWVEGEFHVLVEKA